MEDQKQTISSKGVISSISSPSRPNTVVFKSTWESGTAYSKSQQVLNDNDLFICSTGHTSEVSNEPGVGANWRLNAHSI